MSPGEKLRQLMERPDPLVVPGVYDGLSLRLTEATGFEAAFLSGAGLSMARFGRPDLGFVGIDELTSAVAAMTETTSIPLIVDIDTGFGNALNVKRTVKLLERAGAAALQMEDQTSPKRCGQIAGKTLIGIDEMTGKIRAACEARADKCTVIIARTDALSVTSFKDAIDRAEAYLQAGADALFIQSPKSIDMMKTIAKQFSDRVPLVHNFVEGGSTPITTMSELKNIGYKIGLFPLAFMHAAIPAGKAMLEHLKHSGNTVEFPGPSDDLQRLNDYVDLQEYLARSEKFS